MQRRWSDRAYLQSATSRRGSQLATGLRLRESIRDKLIRRTRAAVVLEWLGTFACRVALRRNRDHFVYLRKKGSAGYSPQANSPQTLSFSSLIPQCPIVRPFVVFLLTIYVLLLYQLMCMLKGAKICHVQFSFCIRGHWQCFIRYPGSCIRGSCRISSHICRHILDKPYYLDFP